jgi:hypothetical protein
MHKFVVAALTAAVAAGSALAQQVDQPVFLEVDVNTVLRVHPYPSIHAPVVARLPDGIVATNLGCQPGEGRVWCHVKIGHTIGWAARDYMIGSGGPVSFVHMPPPSNRVASSSHSSVIHCRFGSSIENEYCHTDSISRGGGDATFAIVTPDNGIRHIVFHNNSVTSDGFGDVQWTQSGDINEITIGTGPSVEHFSIPNEMRF